MTNTFIESATLHELYGKIQTKIKNIQKHDERMSNIKHKLPYLIFHKFPASRNFSVLLMSLKRNLSSYLRQVKIFLF